MKKIKVEDAVGQTLCHDMTAILESGFKGVAFRRGHVISAQDIPKLKDIGKDHIFIWDPAANEVHEEDAAIAVAAVLGGDELTRSGPSEGKIQLSSAIDGLFCVNAAALTAINSLPDYTIACRSDCSPVSAGEKLCGCRIVPLVTGRENMDRAVEIARESYPIMRVLPYKKLKCGVIITGSEVFYGRIEDKFQPIMEKKLRRFGGELLGVIKCPDDVEAILSAIGELRAGGAELILLTGGMSVDPDDVTPSAIRQSGARLVCQGVPMQPGNMLTIAYLDGTTLIGVPGASMHFETTSLDVFLPRVFAGLEIRREDVAAMGAGGFCMGCAVCHYPLCSFGRN